MRSPAHAIAWEFRKRFVLVALAGYPLALAAGKLILGPGASLRLDPPNGNVAVLTVPFSTAFLYLLAVFSFGLGGDVAARQSIFPARMFTLPVTTRALAGWPMLLGSAAMASLWLMTAAIARWSWGLVLPWIWPGLLAAAWLAWTQALTWMPYGLPGLRVVVAVLWVSALDAAVILAVHFEVRESWLVALLLPQLPLAYLAACLVLARARRGDVPDWRGAFARVGSLARTLSPQRSRFPSPGRAQAWFEWRQRGRDLPALVAMLLPFELGLLYLARHEPPVLVYYTLVAVLLTPPFMAGFTAATAGSPGRAGADSGATLAATRPLTTVALVGAKLLAALRSTLAAWLLVLVAVPAALALTGTWPTVAHWVARAIEILGAPRAVATALLLISGLVASTWKGLVQSLCITLTGRAWVVRTSVLLRLSLLTIVGPLHDWIGSSKRLVALLWDAWPWLMAGLVCAKMSGAAWTVPRLRRERLLSDHGLVAAAAAWSGLVLALYGLLVWLVCTPPLVPRYFPALVAILAVPLVRVSAAPLALAWSRHRGVHGQLAAVAGGTRVSVAVLALLSLPVALVLVEALRFEAANRNNGTIVSSGRTREYLLHVPKSYDGTKPTPLVISLHGAGGWPAMQRDVTQWSALADREGFLVVYPSGLHVRGPRVWNARSEDDDVRFISDLIDALARAYNVDRTRIYADGLSNGGGMAFVLSCRMQERIAAVGMVASALLKPFDWCTDRHAVPMIAVHGTADRLTPYHGGTSWMVPSPLPDIPGWTADWARRNRCGAFVETTAVPGVTRREYRDCADGATVALYAVEGGGHTWPSGGRLPEWLAGPTDRSLDATSLMWAFYRAHPLRRSE